MQARVLEHETRRVGPEHAALDGSVVEVEPQRPVLLANDAMGRAYSVSSR